MARQHKKRIRIKAKRLSQVDESQLALAIWLMAKLAIEQETRRPQPGLDAVDGNQAVPALEEAA